jgi:predicted nucleotidyltransferase
MDPQAAASALVHTRFPGATGLLTGSVATGTATATSDLDIVVVVEDGPAEWRETMRAEGWLVELFVHTEASLREWYAREAEQHVCTLAHMVATGVAIADPAKASVLIHAARAHVEHGPPPRTQEQIDAQRYHLTAAVDDLLGCSYAGLHRRAGDRDDRPARTCQPRRVVGVW